MHSFRIRTRYRESGPAAACLQYTGAELAIAAGHLLIVIPTLQSRGTRFRIAIKEHS
jgi:hypothetical protein